MARAVFILLAALLSAPATAWAQQKLAVRATVDDRLAAAMAAAFGRRHPEVALDWRGEGRIGVDADPMRADVLWAADAAECYRYKIQGRLLPYLALEQRAAVSPFADYDGSCTAVHFTALVMAYNARFVKTPPRSWLDPVKPQFKGAYGIVDPARSGTSLVAVAILARSLGWSYFEALRGNGAQVVGSAVRLLEDTAASDLFAGLAPETLVRERIGQGAPLAVAHPSLRLLVPATLAITKDSTNRDAARKFVDFVLSREGQAIVAAEGHWPVRADVAATEKSAAPAIGDALKQAAALDYAQLAGQREAIAARFADIMRR